MDPAQTLNQYFLVSGASWTDFGVLAAEGFIKQGYVIVATDYQGLGGGGSMGLSGAGKKAAIYGWSQGGNAVVAAANMPDYINKTDTAFAKIELVGFVAMAPEDIAVMAPKGSMDETAASKVFTVLAQSFSDTVFNFTHYAMSMWAVSSALPYLKSTNLFTDDGAKALDDIFSKKMHARCCRHDEFHLRRERPGVAEAAADECAQLFLLVRLKTDVPANGAERRPQFHNVRAFAIVRCAFRSGAQLFLKSVGAGRKHTADPIL